MSVEVKDYSRTDEEVDQLFTNLINDMKMNNLSVDDMMEINNVTTESTFNDTNFTTDYMFDGGITPFATTDGPDIWTINNDATNTFTEILSDMTTDDIMIGHLDGMNPVYGPCDAAAGSEPVSFDSNNGSPDEEMKDSPVCGPQGASYDLDPNGHSKPGYKWCCDRWWKDDGNFKKHLQRHDKQLPCEAEPPSRRLCFEVFADDKDRKRHYWVHHKRYAKEQKIPDEKCRCENCNATFSRKDRRTRHLNKNPKCRAAVEQMYGNGL